MNNTLTLYRNMVMHGLYTKLLKPLFFHGDPEKVHDYMTWFGAQLGGNPIGRALTSGLFNYQNEILHQNILGINFSNPIGLSAGFDKNGELVDILPSVGFGFAEIGSITGNKCEGNPKPRLWRLPKSQSLAVYYGLKNDGCETISSRLSNKHFSIPIGVSVAMTNCIENIDIKNAVKDFAKAFKVMSPVGDYITVNISCPNTHGGQPFITPYKLDYLLDILDEVPTTKPVFIKLSPDMEAAQIDEVLDVAHKHRVQGIICANLTKKKYTARGAGDAVPSVGGISGKTVQGDSNTLLKYVHRKELERKEGRFVLVGVGGVFCAEDAYKKIRLGASLVQIITGMIYEGPQLIGEINRKLAELLKQDGFINISQAIGVDNC